jgi:hypothetical protein
MLAGLIGWRDASTHRTLYAMKYSAGDPHPSACPPCTRMTDPTGKWESGSSTPPGLINPLVRSGGSRQKPNAGIKDAATTSWDGGKVVADVWLREGSSSASAGPFSLSTDPHPCKPGYLASPKASDQDVLGGLLDPAGVLLLLAAASARRCMCTGIVNTRPERNLGDVFLGLSANDLTYLVHAPDSSL